MEILATIIAFLETSKYVLIFFGSFVEGSAVMITTGLLVGTRVVEFWPAYIALLIGDIVSDFMWYSIGFLAARPFLARWGSIFGATPQVIDKVAQKFNVYNVKILIISKLTMGFGFAVPILIVAGMLRVPLIRFVTITILGGLVWNLMMMSLGYYFGDLLQYFRFEIKMLLVIALAVLFFVMLRAISRYSAKINW